MYDPLTGRFLSRDPFPGIKDRPPALQRYVYVANNPVTQVDPSGLLCAGPTVSGIVAEGVVAVGFAGTAGGGIGGCFGGSDGLNAGAFAQAGAYMGMPAGPAHLSYPEGEPTATLGMFAGAGLGGFISNATSIQELKGPFQTVSIDVGLVVVNGSIQFSWSNGIWVLNVSPPPVGVGLGAAVTTLRTNTWILWSTDVPKQAMVGGTKNVVLR